METAPEKPREYRAVFFDLDGTLLPMDLHEFLSTYYRRLAEFVGAHGYDVEAFVPALNAGVRAMTSHDGGMTNETAFWTTFFGLFHASESEMRPLVERFYATEFGRIGEGVRPDTAMVRAVDELAKKGYPLVLATMPLFPPTAVRWRLSWAGIDSNLFSRLTTFDNSTSTKPKAAFYAENIAACGVQGVDVLMVGNNTVEDLCAQDLGADVYLVTNHLLDPVGYDLTQVKHGASEDFATWVSTLPACTNPADLIMDGKVDAALTRAVLERDADAAALSAEAERIRAAKEANERIARKGASAREER